MSKLIISGVEDGSIAQEAGIEAGDRLVSITGQPIGDIFDYRFLSSEEEVLLEVYKADGELLQVEIEKDEWEELGLSFEMLLSGFLVTLVVPICCR